MRKGGSPSILASSGKPSPRRKTTAFANMDLDEFARIEACEKKWMNVSKFLKKRM